MHVSFLAFLPCCGVGLKVKFADEDVQNLQSYSVVLEPVHRCVMNAKKNEEIKYILVQYWTYENVMQVMFAIRPSGRSLCPLWMY